MPLPAIAHRAAFLAPVLFLSASAEEWILTFDTREEKITTGPTGDAPPKTATRTYTWTVVLGADYLVLQDDRRKTVFDFTRKRMRLADLTNKTLNDLSLFHLPSFFEHELANRARLGAAMRSAKIEQAAESFNRFDDETALRVTLPAKSQFDLPPPVIEAVTKAGAIEFRHAGKTAVRFEPSTAALPATWHHRFVNFLAYGCNIHPGIRRGIAATGATPQELMFTWRTLNTSTTMSLRLISSVAASTNSSDLPPDARPAAPAGHPLAAILARVTSAADDPARPSPESVTQFADEAIEAKRPLDALMALIEYGLQSGVKLTDALRRHNAVFKRDPACQAYSSAFAQSDKPTVEKSLAINAGIDRHGLAKAHMLDLQRANLLERAGRPREALDALLKVVQANPCHTGALHDLGGLFLRNYEHDKAWLCWDAARRLYPGHPMMRDVIRIELDLVGNQPDFF